MQQPARPKMSADQWEALASSWARHGMPVGRVKTARRCVEAGIQLLMLKEVTPHGQFLDRVNALGFGANVAAKYMAVARRFRGAPVAFFDAIGSASRLVELLALDSADALAQGKAGQGLTLDRVAQMTVKELRAAVRLRNGERARNAGVLGHNRTAAVRLNAEEERMLRRYRKCNAEGRAVLLQVAGLLEQAPAP